MTQIVGRTVYDRFGGAELGVVTAYSGGLADIRTPAGEIVFYPIGEITCRGPAPAADKKAAWDAEFAWVRKLIEKHS